MIDLRPMLAEGPLYVHCRNRAESEEFWVGVNDQFHNRSWDDGVIRTVLRRVDDEYDGSVVFNLYYDNRRKDMLCTNWCDLDYYVFRGYHITEFNTLIRDPVVIEPLDLESVEIGALFS